MLGDTAVLIILGESIDESLSARVHAAADALRLNPPPGLQDVVPAFASIALFFKPGLAPTLSALLPLIERALASAATSDAPPRRVEIPVVYGGDGGPDLAAVAERAGLTPEEVIEAHAAGEYLVHAVGFSPGFPYLGGLAPALATPRRPTPRPRVPAGSVGIGGAQTGVYPIQSPGGWNLIGRTPLRLFDAARPEPALLRVGDRVTFRRLARAEFPPEAEPAGPKPGKRRACGIEVLRPGMLTTVQDLGRPGHRAEGLPLGGAADAFAMRVANLLVGNDEHEAGLELTLVGPSLRFTHDALVALCGAEFDALPTWRPFVVRAGETLDIGPARRGCRGYLAIAGGVNLPAVLGSRSTFVRARLGGLAGRSLQTGDFLPLERRSHISHREGCYVAPRILPDYFGQVRLRVVEGTHRGEFPPDALDSPFVVSKQSDRMGIRLEGAKLQRANPRELLSAPVAPGTVQVPPDGQPIILFADAQTIGGYPRLAHVAAVDWPILAQRRPGDALRFEWISHEQAAALAQERERVLAWLKARLMEH